MPAAEGNIAPAQASNTANSKMKPSARAVGQVMAALKNSKSSAGPTMTEIVKFVSASLVKPATKRQICTALKRGVKFGILKRKRGHYLISPPEDNFSKVPVSSPTPAVKKLKRNNNNNNTRQHSKLLDKVTKRKRGNLKARRHVRQIIEQVPRFTIPEKPLELEEMYRNRPSAFSSATTLVDADKREIDFHYV